jgi:hypothetical protein
MANKFTRFLNGIGTGLLTPKGQMANFQHATRLFIDDTFRLSPRTKFLFYVRFELDKSALTAPAFTDRHADEVGLLVKATDLPKFTFDSTVKNQYNRKKIVYRNFNYEPITITLHDDSAGVVNALWAIYYGYYIRDRNNPDSAYTANHLRARDGNALRDFRYGLDNNISTPIFKSISIYTMSRRRFLGYTLINPKIKSWNHGQVDYSAGDTLQSQMTVEYESVAYSAGSVTQNSPKGFATLHYDTVPSPLTVAGGGTSTLLGQGGVLDGLESIFGNLANGSTFNSAGGFLGTAIATINTYKNFKNLSSSQVKNELGNVLQSPAVISRAVSTIGGVVGAVFPKNSQASDATVGSQKKVVE